MAELAPDTKGQRVDPDDIDTTMNGWKQSVPLTLQSITNVDKKLQMSDITVDLKVAKVYGYPSDSATVLHINPFTLVSSAGLTAEEMTAATLHEVGHAFTHLEYAHRTVKTLTMLMEGVLDGIKSSKKPIDAIKLGYYKAFEDDGIKDTKSVVSASIGIASKYITQHKDYGDNSYANKEGERLADYFATQFGVGVPLVSALKKLNEHTDGKHSDVSFSKTVVMVTVLLFAVNALLFAFAPAIGMISLFAMAAIVGLIVPLLITGFVIYVLINSLGALFGRGIDNYNPYDHLERRIKRIKNALVRQLKNGDVTKDDSKGIIAAIETIDIAAANIESYDENLIYRVVGKMFDYSGDQNELRDFDNLVDDMLHNDLFVATKKLEIANAEV